MTENNTHPIQNIFTSSNWTNYKREHTVSPQQESAVQLIMQCRTGELGHRTSVCEECGHITYTPCSCNNRNCPICGSWRRDEWAHARESERIDGVDYYHITCTVPHELNPLILNNQKLLLGLLLSSSSKAVIELAQDPKYLGATPGIVSVLHTWGSALTYHPHVHMIVTAGGLNKEKKFIQAKRKDFFLPHKCIADLFRGKFLHQLRKEYDGDELEFTGTSERYKEPEKFQELMDLLYTKGFNTHIVLCENEVEELNSQGKESPVQHLGRYTGRRSFSEDQIKEVASTKEDLTHKENVINYLARFSSSAAITESRIQKGTKDSVVFEYKDYRDNGTVKLMELDAMEFIRRFLLHILPSRFCKIRYYGFLSNSRRSRNLHLIRTLLKATEYINKCKGKTTTEKIKILYHRDVTVCPYCGGRLQIIEEVDHRRRTTIRA